MKKQLLSLLIILTVTTSFAQKKEKVKGNSTVTSRTTTVPPFQSLVLNENFEVKLIKSDAPSVQITIDDNLHQYIKIDSQNGTLSLSTTAKLKSRKREITIFYDNLLNTVELNEDAKINSENSLKFTNLTLSASGKSRANLTLESDFFKLNNNNKSKLELNITAKQVTLELNHDSKIKALINASNINANLLKSAEANLEGNAHDLTITAYNSTEFKSEKLNIQNTELQTKDKSKVSVKVSNNLSIDASGSSEVKIYGRPKITIEKFEDDAVLIKKPI